MDNQRLLLFVALVVVVMMIWAAWQQDYGGRHPTPTTTSQPAPGTQAQGAAGSQPAGKAAPAGPGAPAAARDGAGVAHTDLPPSTGAAKPRQQPAQATPTRVLPTARRIHVDTDIMRATLDTTGGDLRRLVLPHYAVSAKKPDQPFVLMNDTLPKLFVLQSGLLTSDGPQPTHHVQYTADRTDYKLGAGQNSVKVALHWRSPEGVTVTKIYTFHRGSYVVNLEHKVHNGSSKPWTGRVYRQLQRTQVAEPGATAFIHTYMGGVIYSPEDKFQKIDFSQMVKQNLSRDIKGGWAAMTQHYFLGAVIPPAGLTDHYYTKVLSHSRYVIGMVAPAVTIAPGADHDYKSRLYLGPKLQNRLATVAPGLDLTVDYGKLTVLAQPIFWALSKLHGFLGNWGWAIIVLTILIKAAFYKLSETSYRSMAQMRKMAPRLKALRERYGDDKQRLNQAMMELYKTEKINPLGGCLPIVVQIPVFIALYWVLLESVELRQAPWVLWIHDLSTPDPYYVLPLIMGVTMLIQNRLNPAPMDPLQKKMMMVLPIAFTAFFAFFPSGLVLYWVVNNTLSIAQQWSITRRIERGAKA
ncbi:MAG TPA: membrane protein insertase YidC [Gammaproteobacteria bacterium]|nr:membrane protein insertase YidC [Gammaproteobacteria bacterium]